MVDRRSKHASSVRDRTPSVIGDTTRSHRENFVSEFLKFLEEYNVQPLPRLAVRSGVDVRVSSALSQLSEKLPDCRINAFGIMQIAEMLTRIGCLRDLNLDMNPNAQDNFHLLCAPTGNLRYLSLKLCQISDDGMKKIANELKYQDPPNDPKLIILNLTNNHITTYGAAHVACMLRTNRSLKSLILFGNRICDDGASLIIQQLKVIIVLKLVSPHNIFKHIRITLTHEEIVDLRRRKFAELTLRDQRNEQMEKRESEEINKSVEEEVTKKNSKSRLRHSLNRRSKKSHRDSLIKIREEGNSLRDLESVQETFLEGEKHHPFRSESFPISGSIMATGNLELQHLDLSYNYLTKSTLKELIDCLRYQNYMLLGDSTKGLLHVFLVGGNIKRNVSVDWSTYEELLNLRQSGDSFTNDIFREFVSEECEILRKNIKISKAKRENSNTKQDQKINSKL